MKKQLIPITLFALMLLFLFIPGKTDAAVGGADKYIGSAMGVTRDHVVNTLTNNAWKYLGSIYKESDYANDLIWAQGTPRSDGYVGMNCAGWVARAFMDVGANLDPISKYNNSGGMGVAGASTWANYVFKTNTRYYTYATKEEMLADGRLKKGDIVYTAPRAWSEDADTHLCIFWGDDPYDDKTWHQIGQGNCITPLREGCPNSQWYVFPLDSGGDGKLIYQNDTWEYVRDGMVDYSYCGLVPNYGQWFFVSAGEVDWTYTNLVLYNGTWFYVHNGQIDWTYNSLAQVDGYGQYYKVTNGAVDFGFNGFCMYENNWYYVRNGGIDWGHHGLEKGYDGEWYYVNGGYIDRTYTGLQPNFGNWFYVEKGKVNWGATTLCENQYGWWKVTNGVVDFGFNGFAMYEKVWYYIRNGFVDWGHYGLEKGYDGEWYYVNGGYIDRTYTGLQPNFGNWFYVEKGKVNWGADTLCKNQYGLWKVKNGMVDFSFTGDYEQDGTVYHIVKGLARNKK